MANSSPSNNQGKLVVRERFSTTGPATPKQAALIGRDCVELPSLPAFASVDSSEAGSESPCCSSSRRGGFKNSSRISSNFSKSLLAKVRSQFHTASPSWPRFHLILLGLGEDGHTASLFPGSEALDEQTRLAVPAISPKGIPQRITLTIPVINHAETVLFLVSGTGKASPLKQLLEPASGQPDPLPAGRIKPLQGRLIWIIDQAAASQLTVSQHHDNVHEG